MELNKDNFEEDNSYQLNINIRDQISKYLQYWKWFLLSFIICILFVLVKLNFTTPYFKSFSAIQIKDTKGRANESDLAAFEELGIDTRSNRIVEDEIEVLKSKRLITKTVKDLKLNIQFFTDENSVTKFIDDQLGLSFNYFKKENYIEPPLKINFLMPSDKVYEVSAKFIITITSPTEYIFVNLIKDSKKKYTFGEKIQTSFGDIIITPNFDKESSLIGSDVLVKILPLKSVIANFMGNLEISTRSEFSSILDLTLNGPSKEKSEDFLNRLVKIYNDEAIKSKDLRSKKTAEFVKNRLEIISNELSDVDITAEKFKQRNRLSDMATETGINLQSGSKIENELVEANTELQLLESVKSFIATKSGDELIPVNLGFADANVDNISNKYNELILEKERLLKSSTEKNPIVVNLNEQINRVKKNLDESLNNLQASKQISLNALTQQNSYINSKIYSTPRKERQYRDIQRQQQIKEALFLYVLQKREESAMSLGVAGANSKMIDKAESRNSPISPKKTIAYLAALIMGAFIPFSIIYVKNFFDTKVHTREEIEKILNIPILGDTPKLETKKQFLISKRDHSSIAEAFRILRTNLSFLLTHTNQKGKTIFVTSTIAHEGKSFVASNLAASLGFAGKKTLIIGMDIRAPGIKPYLDIRGTKGVTNYIIDSELSVDDIIFEVPKVENLDLISSGDIAPNPAELLMHPRVKILFDTVKEEYDYIIVDTAASSVVADTMLLHEYSDAFVYVIRANFLDKRRLAYIHSMHKDNRLPNMALLINGVDHKKSYGYGYGYGYGVDFDRKKSRPWWKLKAS